MPELPEVETVRLGLSKIVYNSKIEDVDVLRSDLRWKIKKSLKHDTFRKSSCNSRKIR